MDKLFSNRAMGRQMTYSGWPYLEKEIRTGPVRAMPRAICAGAVLVMVVTSAMATTTPRVPKSAKKLTGNEIVALYDNTWFTFHNFMKPATTGTFLVNFSTKTASGTYVTGKRRGAWIGTVRIRGDQFCRTINNHREGCVFLYVDGADVFEVNVGGVLESKNRKR